MPGLFKTDQVLDCYGLLCPVPVRKTAQALEGLRAGQVLQVIATDEWFGPDLQAWLRHQPHELLTLETIGQEIHAYLRKKNEIATARGLPAKRGGSEFTSASPRNASR